MNVLICALLWAESIKHFGNFRHKFPRPTYAKILAECTCVCHRWCTQFVLKIEKLSHIIAELRRPEGPPSGAPYSSWERKGNPWVDFLMVIMASGIARGRVRTTTTTAAATESLNMAAKHQIYETWSLGLLWNSLILDIHVMVNWHLSIQDIRWPILRGHITGSSWDLIEVTFFGSLPLTKCCVFLLNRGLL